MSSDIILNEREYIIEAISNNDLHGSPYKTLRYAATYYYSIGLKPSEVRKKIEEFLIKSDNRASIARWDERLDKIVRSARKYPLNEIDSIGITKNEINSCKSAGTIQFQRLAFTMLCLAKYYNIILENGNGWINKEQKDVFRLANVTVADERKSLMERKLFEKGLIQLSDKINSSNTRVLFVDNSTEYDLAINKFKNLGYQYEMFIKRGKGFSKCKLCGDVFRTKGRDHKYCKICGDATRIEKARKRVSVYRSKNK